MDGTFILSVSAIFFFSFALWCDIRHNTSDDGATRLCRKGTAASSHKYISCRPCPSETFGKYLLFRESGDEIKSIKNHTTIAGRSRLAEIDSCNIFGRVNKYFRPALLCEKCVHILYICLSGSQLDMIYCELIWREWKLIGRVYSCSELFIVIARQPHHGIYLSAEEVSSLE